MNALTGFALMAVLFGLSDGAVTCVFVCVREMIPQSRRGVSVGIVVVCGMTGIGIGAYMGGVFFDLTGNTCFPSSVPPSPAGST